MEGQGGKQRPPSRLDPRLAWPQEDGQVEVTRRRGPGAAAAAAAGGLRVSKDRETPRVSGVRRCKCRILCGGECGVPFPPPTRRRKFCHPNRAFAAVLAAPRNGAGKKKNTSVKAPVASATKESEPERASNGASDGSKNITLMMRR